MSTGVKSVIPLTLLIPFLCVGSVSAQSVLIIGNEAQLMPLSAVEFEIPTSVKCGDYLIFREHSTNPKTGVVIFITSWLDLLGNELVSMPTVESDKLLISVVNNAKVPKVKLLPSGGPTSPWIEISMSWADLAKATCSDRLKVTWN